MSERKRNGNKLSNEAVEALVEASVPRILLENYLFGSLERMHIAAICSSKGMGKSTLAARCMVQANEKGWKTHFMSLAKTKGEESARAITACRIRPSSKYPDAVRLLIIDDIPPLDEAACTDMAQAVLRKLKIGVYVILCVEPAAEQLVEELGIQPIRNSLLRVGFEDIERWGDACSRSNPESLWTYTHGIPCLLDAVRKDGTRLTQALDRSYPFYERALSELIKSELLCFQSEEERRLKLGMLLLGRGSFAELEEVAGCAERDMLQLIQRNNELFGVDCSRRIFECAGYMLDSVVESALACTRERGEQDVAHIKKALELLASRDEFVRAALIVGSFADSAALNRFLVRHAAEFIHAGCLDMVQQTLNASNNKSRAWRTARFALRCLLEGKASLDILYAGESEHEREARQLSDTKLVLLWAATHDVPCPVLPEKEKPSVFEQGMQLHLRMREDLFNFDFTNVFRVLLSQEHLRVPTSLSGSLLVLDFEIARCLAGDPPNSSDEDQARKALDFLGNHGFSIMADYYRSWLSGLTLVFGRNVDTKLLERCSNVATTREEHIHRALLLLLMSASDVCDQRFIRAHIHAEAARDSTHDGLPQRMYELASFLDAFAQFCLGDVKFISQFATTSKEPALAYLASYIEGYNNGHFGEGNAYPFALPSWMLPLCEIVFKRSGKLAAHAFDTLPPNWRAALVRFERQAKGWFPDHLPAMENKHKMPGLRVELLGGFVVYVDGRRISEADWRRRASKELLALLAVAPGHKVTRAQAIETLWPERDYETGRNSLYAATSRLKGLLCRMGSDEDYITGKGGLIELNMAKTSCDVDDFELLCTSASLDERTDSQRLELCRRIEAAYGGELFVPVSDAMSVFFRRKEELRIAFEDNMALGAQAALRLGRLREAVWLARSVLRSSAYREDAVYTLVRALILLGKQGEARGEYEQYVSGAINILGVAPSSRIRSLFMEDPKTRVHMLTEALNREKAQELEAYALAGA